MIWSLFIYLFIYLFVYLLYVTLFPGEQKILFLPTSYDSSSSSSENTKWEE